MENSRCPERCLRKPRNKILVLMIATGPECIVYIPPAIEALKKFFPPHDVLVFTDSEEPLDAIKVYHPHTGCPPHYTEEIVDYIGKVLRQWTL